METRQRFDDFVSQFFRLLPEDLDRFRGELERNLRAAFSATLARMDLVTREEFDVQAELLARTRALLEEMEKKVRELEERLNANGGNR
jgi:BMFP domain-containing protein YqiC